jgi:homoaconitate hydratase
MAQTVVEKLAQSHLADAGPGRPVRAGDFVALRPDHVLTHDNTAAVIPKFRAIGATRIADPRQPVFALDHDIQNRSPQNLAKYAAIEAFANEHGITAYPACAGIGHQLMVENLHARPGALVVASDSHANTYGAVGALGTPVVRTDAAAIWATGSFWWQVPRTVRVILHGALEPGVSGKDVALTLCGMYPQGEVLNAALEFCGDGVRSLDMDARLTLANMSTEWGALTAWFPVDAVTLRFLRRRQGALARQRIERIGEAELSGWEQDPPGPDPDAAYAATISLDLETVTPQVAGPDFVHRTEPLATLRQRRVPIHKAYLVSCVNARTDDLETAARVLEGRKVADGVELLVAAASREIQARAEASGAWQTLLAAGAKPLPPGCGPCIGLGEGLLEPGEVGISATNRNFKGRMGSRDAQCYLASPAVVAASAVAGCIEAPLEYAEVEVQSRIEFHPAAAPAPETVAVVAGFPARVEGRLAFVPQDDLNTDGIYGKEFTYREDLGPQQMAEVVMRNHDPDFAARVRAGDVLVGGRNFGCGSSREQAATALMHKGIPLLIAASYSDTFLRNAFNNGFLCLEQAAFCARLWEAFAEPIAAGAKTIFGGDAVGDDRVEVDLSAGRIRWRGEDFPFTPPSRVAQDLIVAGGIENQIRARLAEA